MARKKRAALMLAQIGQLVTCAGSQRPKRGAEMNQLGIADPNTNAIAIRGGKIVGIGESLEMFSEHEPREVINCDQMTVVPAFVDPHTHAVFGGDRVNEYEMRIKGASYMEIMAAGGGIVSTVAATRAASEDALYELAKQRLELMWHLGTQTFEIKTGYGLDTATELKMLRVIERLDEHFTMTIVPTFLGAHTLPVEYKDDAEGYIAVVINEMIPAVADWYASSRFAENDVPLFIDVFCEDHAFTVEQSRRILAAGVAAGMRVKAHVDQFNVLGGTQMSIELGALSADHLDATDADGIAALAASDTIAVPLPAANFNLGHTAFAPARQLIDAGAALALATDLNPGSAPCYSMPLVMAIATRYLKMTPAEALTAATINAAHAIGMAHLVGSIEIGKKADLLVLNSADYRDLTYFLGDNKIEHVI